MDFINSFQARCPYTGLGGFFIFMNDTEIFYNLANSLLDQSKGELNLYQAMELSTKMIQAQALSELAYAFRQDGEFQESMTQIANALK